MALIVTPGASYTWATASWSWVDALASKTWEEAYSSAYLETDAEAVTAAEARAAESVLPRSESLALAEARRSLADFNNAEPVGLAEVRTDLTSYVRLLAETLSTAESSINIGAFVRAATESIGMAEARAGAAAQALAEALVASEAGSRDATYIRLTNEALAAAEGSTSALLQTFGELVAPMDASLSLASFLRDTTEPVGIAETYIDLIGFINAVSETVLVSEQAIRDASKIVADALGVSEAAGREITQRLAEAIAAAETYIDLIGFLNATAESIAVAEAKSATVGHRSSEPIAAIDRLIRRVNAVVADLAIRSSGMTQEQFAERISFRKPLGNYPPKPLQPGDYRYERAIIGIILQDIARTTRDVAIDMAKITVDVPDVTDRGSATMTSAGETIVFTRSFYDPPEVQVIQTAGSTRAIPSVTTITASGFFVQLFDVATSTTPVAGTISWTALGK